MPYDFPTVADVLEFESWPPEQRAVAERVLGKTYTKRHFEVYIPERSITRLPPWQSDLT